MSSQGERYYIAIAAENDPDNLISIYSAPFADIEVVHQFSEGRYVFEISVGDDSFRQVIMPALDDKNKPLTQLIVLKGYFSGILYACAWTNFFKICIQSL